MTRLLTCECGEQVPVSEGAAGTTVACGCGRTLLAPGLHEMRKLPLVSEPDAAAPGHATPVPPNPVAKICPQCGSGEFITIRPNKFVAFAHDRICTACRTRYTPPTPVWAAIVFLLIGLPLAGFGGLGLLLGILQMDVLSAPRLACEGFLAVLGVLAIVQGIRALARPGKV